MSSAKRPYPHKAENERRIVVSFSLSDVLLRQMRERLAAYMHTEPTMREVQAFARGLAYEAIENYLAQPFVPEDEEE